MRELDAVATNYFEDPPSGIIAEAKSGADAGFASLFKILGWMKFLGIPRGALFTSKGTRDPALVEERLGPHGLTYAALGDCSDAKERFERCGLGQVRDQLAVEAWRLSYGIERRLYHDLRLLIKPNQSQKGAREVQTYLRLIGDETFFEPDVRQRVRKLYDAFQDHPHLGRGCALEIAGLGFDAEADAGGDAVLEAALYWGKHPLLQIAFYAEHRARLTLLKAAIDYSVAAESGAVSGVAAGQVDWQTLLAMPSSFRTGLEKMSTEPYFRRYAVFWQVFLWGWGGFYLIDRTESEFRWLADQTGVPPEEIPRALRAMDLLFPHNTSWIVGNGPTQMKVAKLFPYQMRIVGAVQRLARYEINRYSDLGYTDMTARDLARWHNDGIDFWNLPRKKLAK
jgi:hypothetical protein